MVDDPPMKPSGPSGAALVRRWAPLAVIAGAMTFAFAMGWHRYLSLSTLIENREMLVGFVDSHLAAALAAYFVIYVVSVVLSLPGAVFLTIAGGFLFGWLLAGVVTVVAATIGATGLFLAARSSIGSGLIERAGPWAAKLADGFRDGAFNYLLFLRLVPLFPFWLVNLAPAMFGVGLPTYFAATALGILPGTFAFCFIGSGLDSVIAAQREANAACMSDPDCKVSIDPGALLTSEMIMAFVALGIVALIPVVLKHWRGNGRGREK
ncbi:MAG: TVP38/TMEM64 family protein [Hyphomicrobiales bacterium]|nr:TVP38/TMEM64 family protein [Hyphomicrobiales bacterium]